MFAETMLAQMDPSDVAKVVIGTLGIVSLILGLWWGIVQIRQAAASKNSNPGNPGDELLRLRETDEKQWEVIHETRESLARVETKQCAMHTDIVEIKYLLREDRS